MKNQRPQTCHLVSNRPCSQIQPAPRKNWEVWMSFQRHRPVLLPGTAAYSWPKSRPAGLTTLEMDFAGQRAASTRKSRIRNLPPIIDKSRLGNLNAGVTNERQAKDQTCWAKSWAKERAEQTNVHSKDITDCMSHSRMKHFRSLDSLSKSTRKKNEVVAMNEKEAMLFKRLKGIYANSTERTLQAQRLQKSINRLQTRSIHSEIDCSMKEYSRKLEEDKRNRSELKRLRDRYSKDRERRHRSSYVSLTALQCPRVSREAYGLPEEGDEDRQSGVTQHTQEKLRDIWKNAMRRAALVDKIIRKMTKEKDPLPQIRVRRQSIAQRGTRTPSPRQEREELPRDSEETANRLEVMLGEIDAMSTVLSESDEDLADTDEEFDD
ncbi:uncharacterized protein [Montipora foliosa]|uniref:uncharacterized protein isoform X2 n=1 Tax=Montipora foliosa TaxID=591990 RepID=UPI0035F16D56